MSAHPGAVVPDRPLTGAAWSRVAIVITLAFTGACAAKTPAAVAPVNPAFPGYEFPTVVAMAGVTPQLVAQHQASWNLLQRGEVGAAARGFASLAKLAPGFYPALTGQAYSELADRDYREAVSLFTRALSENPKYLPALVGRADALLAEDHPLEAIAALEALLAVDPGRASARSRLEALRLGSIERLVAAAQDAQKRGDFAAAREAWTQAVRASPESGFMLRELAGVERQVGDLDAASGHARQAAALDPQEAAGQALLGDIELARGNLVEAAGFYRRAQELDPGGLYRTRVSEVERQIAHAALPEAFRAIAPSPQLTRADLAALLGVRLEPWLSGVGAPAAALITDVRGHWAQRWILEVARAGVMEVYPNHTFQPGLVVRRGDLASVVQTHARRGGDATASAR